MEHLAAFVANVGIRKTQGEIIHYFNLIHNKLFSSLISGKSGWLKEKGEHFGIMTLNHQ